MIILSDRVSHIPFDTILAWSLLSSEHFFATGHHATITTIRWEAAFHGFHGDWTNHAIPALLISMNSFASQILCGLALPLLVFWPQTRGQIIFAFETKKQETSLGVNKKGELGLQERQDILLSTLSRLILGYVLISGLKVCWMGFLKLFIKQPIKSAYAEIISVIFSNAAAI